MMLGACASTPHNAGDPLEGYNRAMFAFNEQVDKIVLKPVAEVYDTVLPTPLHIAIGNVLGNLADPWIGINNLLQGKVADGLSDLMRFLVNSTLGFLGVLDIASEAGLPKHDEDFGQTLGSWGVGEGAYFVLPFFGPRTIRDAAAFPADLMADPTWDIGHIPTRNTVTAVKVTHERWRGLGTEKTLEEGTLDKYAYVRDFYLEQRRYKVFDGAPPRVYEDFNGASSVPLGNGVDVAASTAVESLELLGAAGPRAAPRRSVDEPN
ncbi:MlaA family lipoprotein [Thauera sinica]|uniref:VacJ family lipoprotein n=1 Tax=Thauera sinica TaxID=2665146 RepID=A0ABW1AXK8_9RHOO|nr:VacJ family lipoprotein [Thauera sp. K11]